jgi:hypothetical protein
MKQTICEIGHVNYLGTERLLTYQEGLWYMELVIE